ncbi:hypothetical protein HNQ50_001437 [Silvimonas terrae]|uniref:Uncharacterized protein n=1 Tax=Silvimonas terrae TaxID=300266 RepID=A0A840RBI9_9NEIS|nr:hypothetical protein [Silvimonas terrae]MBB5190715.1 hypothetical protein [Silvimonas terrae]
MAKQPEDKKTLDLIEAPKKRGRPSTGNAKSAAERMRAMRMRDKIDGGATVKLDHEEIALILAALKAQWGKSSAKNATWDNGVAQLLYERIKTS